MSTVITNILILTVWGPILDVRFRQQLYDAVRVNRRCRIYSGFHFLLAPFKHVKDKM